MLSWRIVTLCLFIALKNEAALSAQQDPLDLGESDSIIIEFNQPYYLNDGWSTTADLYVFNDAQTVVGLSAGFGWDSDALVLDSVHFANAAVAGFNLFRYVYYHDDLEESNFYRLFQCSLLGHPDSGLAASAQPQLVATFYFRLNTWLPDEAACIASEMFVARSLVDPVAGEYSAAGTASACVLAGSDGDGDGVGDNSDNCPGLANADQADADSDTVGDLCDECTDTDDDGYGNPGFAANTCGVDNCPWVYNPDQADADGDDIGDVCEEGCCVGRVGDANGSGSDEPTIGDIVAIIDFLFGTMSPSSVPCLAEADVNLSGGQSPTRADITIGDISRLIDYLFITGESLGLPDCP
jgi:hypothetical protein